LLFLSLASAGAGADTNRFTQAVRQAADYSRKGLQREAEAAAAEALSILEGTRGTPHFDVAAGLNTLSSLAYAQGDLERAEELCRRSRQEYEAVAGPEDLRLATVLFNLAGVYVEQRKYTQALPLYRSVLAMREKALSSADPLLAEVWNDLGFLSLHLGRYKEAETWLGKAVEVWEKTRGSEAYSAVALSNLALLRRLEGSFAVAEFLYTRALAIEESVFGRDHPEVATTLTSLAALYRARGDGGRAVETYQRALAALEKSLGVEDPLSVEVRQQLSELAGTVETRVEFQIITARTREEAESLRSRVERGETFAELAAQHSVDAHAPDGGYSRARLSELGEGLRSALERLGVGQVSPVLSLDGNWAILKKLSAHKPARE